MIKEPVSVVITCFNLEKYISSAILSAKYQTYPGEIQIIVIDDGSTDSSKKILAEFQGIEVYSLHRNSGVLSATLAGIRRARHDVVFFLDGDDVWDRDKLSLCMSKFSENDRFLTHDIWFMNPNGERFNRVTKSELVMSSAHPDDHSDLLESCILLHRDYVWLGSAFALRKSKTRLDDFSAFCEAYPKLQTVYQDWPLAVWSAVMGKGRYRYVNYKLMGYRIHEENYSGATPTLEKRRANLKKVRDTMQCLLDILMAGESMTTCVEVTRLKLAQAEVSYAMTFNSRKNILNSLVRLPPRSLFCSHQGLRIISLSLLSLSLGPQITHRAIEFYKNLRFFFR